MEERGIVAPALYSSLLMEYSTTACVAGLLATMQYGILEAFNYANNNPSQITLETNGATNYVDGVSITVRISWTSKAHMDL